jgi:hypothetical protein
MNPVFSTLPMELINGIMEMRIERVILNLTTGEYIDNFTKAQLKSLLVKVTKNTENWTRADIGESHWKRTDRIVLVPIHIEDYVKSRYSKVYL